MAATPVAPLAASSSVRDRLVTTLFAAAMLHGIVIAGITFADYGHDAGPPGLDVLIVSDEVPEIDRNDSAQYLAQRSQLGGGSTRIKVPPRGPMALPDALPHSGVARGTALAQRGQASQQSEVAVLTTSAHQSVIRWLGNSGVAGTDVAMPLMQDAHRSAGGTGRHDDGQPQLSGPDRKELWITPNTRASILAPWLDAWRNKIERLGTLNYPAAVRQLGAHTNPVVEVSIDSGGKLLEARISRSSGHAEVDQAALDILRLASPFDAFPPEVHSQYRVLRFAYEWEFEGDGVASGSLAVPPGR